MEFINHLLTLFINVSPWFIKEVQTTAVKIFLNGFTALMHQVGLPQRIKLLKLLCYDHVLLCCTSKTLNVNTQMLENASFSGRTKVFALCKGFRFQKCSPDRHFESYCISSF